MPFTRSAVLLACLIFALTSGAQAQSVARRHQLELRLGLWNLNTDVRTEVDASGVSTSVESSGGLGGIAYGYWPQENLALNLSITGMVADSKTDVGAGGVQSVTAVVAPILLGAKYYFVASTLSSPTRPYLKAAAGPFIGSQSSTNVGTSIAAEQRTEAAIGGQLAGGLDVILGRRVMLGAAIGYNIMSDFGAPIGGSVNYSGPEFNIGISLLLGGGPKP
jgi:hypothetical protein